MGEKTTSLTKSPEAPSPSRTPAPFVSQPDVGLTALQGAAGNLAMQRAFTDANSVPDLSDWSNRTPDLRGWSVDKLESKLHQIEAWRGSRISTSPQSMLADVAAAQIRSQLKVVDFARAEAHAVIASLEGTVKDDEDDHSEASAAVSARPRSLSLLAPEDLCQGHCITDEEIYRESNEANARDERQHQEEVFNWRVTRIREAVKNEDSADVLYIFERADAAERIALQRHLDMDAVVGALSDFDAARFGTLGPVIAGQDKFNKKRADYIRQVIDDFLPVAPDRAEIFVLYTFSGVYDYDAYSIFAELANQRRISELLEMPNVAKLIEDRGLETWGFMEPDESWTAVFPGMGRGIKHFVKDDRPGKYQWQKGRLPSEYAHILSQMEMAEFENNLTFKNAVIAFFDEITFGLPHGAVDLVRSTAGGIRDIAHGEYGKAGEKLSGAAVILLTHAAVKAWRGARGAIGGARGPAGLRLGAEAQAAVDRMVERVGQGGVEKAAALTQADSRAAAFVIEHGEAGVYALLEAEGDVVAAANKLPVLQPGVTPVSGSSPDVIQGGGQRISPPQGQFALVAADNTIGPTLRPKTPPTSGPPEGGAPGQFGTGRVANDNAAAIQIEQARDAAGGGDSPVMVRKVVTPSGKPQVPARTGQDTGAGIDQGGRRQRPVDRNPIQEHTVKETPPPQDTHSVRRGPPGANEQPLPLEAGNFAEKNFNLLKEVFERAGIPSEIPISEPIPPNARKFRIEGHRGYAKGVEPEIDALDRAKGDVIEIKPHNLYEQGLAEAKTYASDMDRLHPLAPERLADGTFRPRYWNPKCITYDGEAMRTYWERVRAKPTPEPAQ